MSKFQLTVILIFGAFIALGVFVFATSKGGPSEPPVTVWGSLDETLFANFLKQTGVSDGDIQVTYREVSEKNFDGAFVESLASGVGPDLIILPEDKIVRHLNKLFLIPFDSYSARDFRENFIEGTEVFMGGSGVVGIPFTIDPMVMYWNRDLFSQEAIPNPPTRWSEFFALSERLTKGDSHSRITQSLASLGAYGNINHAKELLSTLIIQAGSPIVTLENGTPRVVLSDRLGFPGTPGLLALDFYTEFSNPVKAFYSWNRALPQAQNFFLAGDLALYFAPASELSILRDKNPNLNFDVALIPQSLATNDRYTFAHMTGLSIVRNSQNIGGAFQIANQLTTPTALQILSNLTNLPPVHRKLLAKSPSDLYQSVFYTSAIWARSFLDPNPKATDLIFEELVDSVVSGRERGASALNKADGEITNLF
jgi:ABC-type glycerol-3-phosphate transport system substrate-binding protein